MYPVRNMNRRYSQNERMAETNRRTDENNPHRSKPKRTYVINNN
jgi:hypothetical protein